MVRQAELKQKSSIQAYNRKVAKYNREAKRAVNDYNREVRAYNAQVRRNGQRLKSELDKLATQPAFSARTHVTYRMSVETLQTSFGRLEAASRNDWGPVGDELFDLAEGEAANSVQSLNVLLDPPVVATERDRAEIAETSITDELSDLSPDLDKRWRGALYALNPANPDAARHFCTSSREILVSVLDIEAPDEAVLREMPDCPRTDTGRPTRRAKVQFCLYRKALIAPELADFVDEDLENVATLFATFNDATHGTAGTFDLVQLVSLKARVEDAIRFLHRLAR
jgi:hypothetical protein